MLHMQLTYAGFIYQFVYKINKMQLTYKFRLYPNKEQKLNLLNTLELCSTL